MTKKKKEVSEEKLSKCEHCKKKSVTYRIHECPKGYQEYFGCNFCDDWCTKCKKDWNKANDKKK